MRSIGETLTLLDGDAPAHWPATAELPLLVLAGVTGVGKSTTLERLARRLPCVLLPDRREIADRVVFPSVQDELGEPRHAVRDRVERFRLTARYRQLHSGGMAHALSRLRVDPAALDGLLVFDGLRGADELEWAIEHLPRACFLALDAPEPVRLARLLGRAEGFDHTDRVGAVPVAAGQNAPGVVESLLAAAPGLDAVMPRPELERLLLSPQLAEVSIEEIARKAAILVEEARNYDPRAVVRVLESQIGPERRLIVDTSTTAPDEVVERVAKWLHRT